jgi:hypothetical protein
MSDQTRRRVLASIGGTVAVGLAGCAGDGGGEATPTPEDEPMDTEEPMETTEPPMEEMANVRVAHMSPDAPNVDVYVGEGDPVLTDVPFSAVSDYLELSPGTYPVQITAAGAPDTVVFDQELEIGSADYTVAAAGELAEDGQDFAPLVLEDDTSNPGSDQARVRLVHLSPDAPAVDVTVAATGDAVFDGLAYRESASVTVPANDYTLEVRGDTDSNDGDVVAEFDVSLAGGAVYTAFAAGYLTPDDDPSDEAFDLYVAQDASY